MAREIKFRVWINYQDELTAFYPERDHDYNECILSFHGGKFSLQVEEIKHEMGSGLAQEYSVYEDHKILHIEQYTGLKDYNGVEIYEGDIIELIGGYNHGRNIKNVVTFSDGRFSGCFGYSSGGDTCHPYVIGNIHENPELLEAKNG